METNELKQMKIDKTICLCAIMKNESKVLKRMIDSCRNIIDYWVFIDTGSTDDSKEVLQSIMKEYNIPGELHERGWVNFEHNRNQLLELSLNKADYLLLLDCDMTVHPDTTFDKSKLVSDSYYIRYIGDLDFAQQLLVTGRKDWRYIGVTHEYINSKTATSIGDLRSLPVIHHSDGGTRSEKLERDRKLLEQDILDNPENTRSYFYLAQTYNNLKLYEKAIKYYQQRINRGGWPEEVYYSKYQMGLMYLQNKDRDNARKTLLGAWEYRPSRIEALYVIGMMAREEKQWNQSVLYLEKCLNTPYPKDDVLFIHKKVYDYLIHFELGIVYYYVGRFKEALDMNEYVINSPNTPPQIKEQALKNAEYPKQKLGLTGVVKQEGTKKFLTVSMFTTGTKYEEDAKRLSESCKKFKVSHEIYQTEDHGSWEKNTQQKPVIIKQAMEIHKVPILWVDVDAEFKEYPSLFLTTTADIMFHWIAEWHEALVGTIYFDYNERVLEFLDKWIELNNQNDLPDGKNFQELILKDITLSKSFIPKEYINIFDNQYTQTDKPVITHYQASRRNKGSKSEMELIQYENTLFDKLKMFTKSNTRASVIGNGPFVSDLSKEIDESFIIRCNNFRIGLSDKWKEIGKKTDLNVSSLYYEIIPDYKADYPILGIHPITDTGYQKYTTAKQMHKYWKENADKLIALGNNVILYDEKERFYHEVFFPISESINAFPSVGILAIGLARWLGFKEILISGFTFFQTKKSHYFLDEKIIPSSHHNVFKEKLLLRSWIESDRDIFYILDRLTREVLYDYKKDKWEKVSQPFELNWHKTQDDWRPKEDQWLKAKNWIFEFTGFREDMLEGLEVLDIGSGPRTMLEYFNGCKKTIIEPLGEEYKKMYQFLNGDPLYSVPAEQFIPELENKFDFIWCHNVLDHCYDWKLILENMNRYLKKGGKFYIGTDAGLPPNPGHPGINPISSFRQEISRYGYKYTKEDYLDPNTVLMSRSDPNHNPHLRVITLIGEKI